MRRSSNAKASAVVARCRETADLALAAQAVHDYVAAAVLDIARLILHTEGRAARHGDAALEAARHGDAEVLALLAGKLCVADASPQAAATMAGQVAPSDLGGALFSGNLREQMTLVMNFAMQGCDVIWRLIHAHVSDPLAPLPSFVSAARLRSRVQRMGALMGTQDPDTLYATLASLGGGACDATRTCSSRTDDLPCRLASLSKDGPVTLSRLPWPDAKPLRTETDEKTRAARAIRADEARPPLSERERRLLLAANVDVARDDTRLPWVTGHSRWNLSPEGLHARLARRFDKDVLCGPSGNADLQLDVLSLFERFDVDCAALACVAWMCNPPDHTPHEVLMACIPYGLQYDGTGGDTRAFVEALAKANSSKRRGQKHGGSAGATTVARRHCPVYLPAEAAGASRSGCDRFHKERPPGTPQALAAVRRCTSASVTQRLLRAAGVSYPETVRAEQYVLGRDRLLDEAGFKALAARCSRLQVLVLPWHDDPAVEGVPSWSPRVNNDLVRCAMEAVGDEPTALRLLICVQDMEHMLSGRSYSKGKRATTPPETTADVPLEKVAVFAPRTRAQSVVEACQILFHYARLDRRNGGGGFRILAEPEPSHPLFYTCFCVPAAAARPPRSGLPASLGGFRDITAPYTKALRARLADGRYKLQLNKTGRYYPEVADETF